MSPFFARAQCFDFARRVRFEPTRAHARRISCSCYVGAGWFKPACALINPQPNSLQTFNAVERLITLTNQRYHTASPSAQMLAWKRPDYDPA